MIVEMKKLNKTNKNFSDHLSNRLDHAWKRAKLDDKVEKLDHSVRVDEKLFLKNRTRKRVSIS